MRRIPGEVQELEETYEFGRRVVNTRNANQSFGTLHDLWREVFAHVALRKHAPQRVLVLGYGAGSVASILHHEYHLPCSITGVEADGAMLELARQAWGGARLERVELIHTDAIPWVGTVESPPFDLVIVDLFIDLEVPDGAAEPGFLTGLGRLTAPDGLLLFNTIEQAGGRAVGQRIGHGLRQVFDRVDDRLFRGHNRVFMTRWKG